MSPMNYVKQKNFTPYRLTQEEFQSTVSSLTG